MLHSKLSTAPAAVLLAVAIAILCCSIGTINAQENIEPNIPPSLVECYNTTFFQNRDNRLPTNIESLIAVIEKVENSDGFNMDIRQLTVALLHRFRQDGIQLAPGIVAQPGVIPYSPTGFQFPKFRILLSRLIPGNALQFPNSSLSREERCSLHFMLSSTFNMQVRGDENQVCNQLSQYRAQRLPRAVGAQNVQNNFLGDMEILESLSSSKAMKRGISAQQYGNQVRPKANAKVVDFDYVDYGYDSSGTGQVSQCPVEDGVIWTPWGAVAAGTVIAGIAAGLQPQQVQLRTLLSLSRRPGVNSPQTATVSVDNRWAATLSGDLAEVALVQVPSTQNQQASVGANGAWNNTVTPHWYFLSQRQNLEMTDAEIRGGLDGLIFAMNIANWRTQASSLKLSQLLRMYYSMDGVLGSGIMACNRKDQFPNVAPQQEMNAQTSAFAQVLNREMQLRVTLEAASIAQFSQSAANALTAYIPQYMNDVSCSVSNSPQDVSTSITAMTNIYVFLDTSWQYNDVKNYVNYIIENLNINYYASSVTLLGAQDGTIIVNTTNYLGDFFTQWNATTHSLHAPGFNLPKVLQTITNITQTLLNGEQTNSTVGGRSLVALLIPSMAQVSDTDSSYSVTRIQYLNERVPDLKFIYYTGGTITRFSAFVKDPTQDIFPLNIGATYQTASSPVLARIKKKEKEIPCSKVVDINPELNELTTTITNIYVFMDTIWPYRFVVNYLNYILERLNIHPYASTVTLISGREPAIMVNTTNYLSDFYENWNETSHSWYPFGFHLPQVLSTAFYLVEQQMQLEQQSFSMGGSSMVALLMPSPTATITDSDFDYCIRFLEGLNRTMPDLHFIWYAGGAIVRFKDLVPNPSDDLYLLSRDLGVREASAPVVERIKRIPRRITNPRCTPWWDTQDWGNNHMVQYARPGTINFYRMSPQYFFGADRTARWFNVQAVNPVTFTVCTSRTISQPYRNGTFSTVPELDCTQLLTNKYSLDLSQACQGSKTPEQCPPLYVSVQAQSFFPAGQVKCNDPACQTPDQAAYAIQTQNLGCYGGVARILLNFIILGISLLLSLCLF